jgi:hypothetical protein
MKKQTKTKPIRAKNIKPAKPKKQPRPIMAANDVAKLASVINEIMQRNGEALIATATNTRDQRIHIEINQQIDKMGSEIHNRMLNNISVRHNELMKWLYNFASETRAAIDNLKTFV